MPSRAEPATVRGRHFFAALLAVFALGHAGAAHAADTTVAVLGIEANEAPDALAADLTDALRQRVASTSGYQLVPGKDLVEIKLVFSCPDEAPSCMAQAAKSLGAAKLLFGSVKKSASGDFVVSLKFLDAERAVVDTWVAEPLPQKQATSAGLRGPVQKWFASLGGQGASAGIVRVHSAVPGASISVDGQSVATTGTEDVVLNDLAPGRHVIRVERQGFRPYQEDVDVVPGATHAINAQLTAGAAAPVVPAAPPADGRGVYRTGFWITLAGGLASAGAAIKFGTDVQQVNRDLDPYRRFTCSTSPTGLCDKSNKAAQPLTAAETKVVNDKRDSGNRAEALQWVFVGVGGAFGVASAYLFYRGYLDQGPKAERHAAAPHGLRLFPVVGGGSGGVLAELDF